MLYGRKTDCTAIDHTHVPDKDCTKRARQGLLQNKEFFITGSAVSTESDQLPHPKSFVNAKKSYHPKEAFQKHNGPMTAEGQKGKTQKQHGCQGSSETGGPIDL